MGMPTRVSAVTQNRHLGQVVVVALSSLSRALISRDIGSLMLWEVGRLRLFPSRVIRPESIVGPKRR